ncbi:restriction endonuclease subunit S [Sulfurospirillum cavolei]|uniref:restriction endonuclease subunit S n=1 Tax=Sulfurospirillum cavolei TaxID=366522 RepID=UPI000A8192C4|nr:restriction endonuclease subunit S [Sulfurospirillum cavolei]
MKNIPKVRFPEFRDTPAWEEKKLGEISTYVDYRGRAPIKTEIGYFLVTAKNIKKGFIDYNCSKEYVAEDDYLNVMSKGLPEIGDILFTTEAPLGNVALVDNKNIALAQRVIKFRNKEMLSNIYLLQYMLSDVFQKAIFCKSIGSTVQGISGKELQQIKLLIPSLKEQQKIAECLSSLDALILAQSSKVEALKAHKKALMQQLFPAEGETTPRLRFPQFQNASEWEKKPLENFFDFLRGSLLSKADIVQNGVSKCIHYGELFTIYKEKISEIKSSTNLENGQFSQNGDILMPSSDVTPEGLATASAIFETGVIIGGDVNLLRPKNQINSLYISYLLNFSKKEIMKLVTGTTVKHIYNKDIAKLEIRIPQQLEEQQKIADCLSSLDALILAQSSKVEALKQHKKALMQQLFPTCKVTS